MTKYAKWMVMANFVLAISFLTWSLGLYSQEMPWQGMIKDRFAPEIRNLIAARNAADERWFTAARRVVNQEVERPQRQAYYDEQLAIAMTGKNKAGQTVTPAIQQLEIRDGLVVMNVGAARKPVMLSDKSEARSMAAYQTAINKALDDTRDTKQRINKVVDDTTIITQQIKGTKPIEEAITAVERGFRGQLIDAKQLVNNLKLEQEFLQTPLTNFKVDLEMLKRRLAALEARLKELGSS